MTSDTEPALDRLYADFTAENLRPLWLEIGDLMPESPRSRAVPHVWEWSTLSMLARRAGDLVPVGRGGERRAIALANPALDGRPFATPTLWAAIQYLNAREDAPVHRHTQNAFRFVIEGSGVWTVVGEDPVAMNRGDFLPQPGWNWHSHINVSDQPMAWIDGLDIPYQYAVDATFFEFGPASAGVTATPDRSQSERLWAHPGLAPVAQLGPTPKTPLLAYRFEHTDAALREQLTLEDAGRAATLEPGHAAVRYVNPTTGGDVMPTIRAEFHRLRRGAATTARRTVGSSVYQVFDGAGEVVLDGTPARLDIGDLIVVPSWVSCAFRTDVGLDLFQYSDAPIIERLHLGVPLSEGA
ncbi:cupin domain-containing protein [Gordonia shandongensis]|uniref:cupin domain-containing protein n=1 Tax=Gordonia shandongensis TaxID=376351 RepID=UPI0004036B04|nr:cupin domain-containing protein [Gordonia shandongensis]